jgi:hypothetical protein
MNSLIEEHGEVIVSIITGLIFISLVFVTVEVLAQIQMNEMERIM